MDKIIETVVGVVVAVGVSGALFVGANKLFDLAPKRWTYFNAGIGAASWDLVPQLVARARYGARDQMLDEFVAGYGAEPSGWPGLGYMCRVYELLATAWATRCAVDSPEMAREASLRAATVLDRVEATWTQM